jgi:cytochrome c-type biogenesis protein CcmF
VTGVAAFVHASSVQAASLVAASGPAVVGRIAVVVGLLGCLLGVAALAVGLRTGNQRLLVGARQYVVAVALAAVACFVAMEWAILGDDYSLQFTADHSARATPLLYKFASLWGALEGSIILWTLLLSIYGVGVLVAFRSRRTDPLVSWATIVMLAVTGFFFALMAGPADPFATLAVAPADGAGPNPLLQNHPLMAIHPVFLYLGFTGFTVPFAFAVAALATGRLDERWLDSTRPWTLFTWGCLTVGIVLGAWWSYEVLGWGGYWAWDPVENVSLLPWLTGTAYLHSVIVQQRRGSLRIWNLSLLLATFCLTILGTFITRSGVLESVHSFTESPVGPVLLGFFVVVVGVSLGLIFWRGDQLRSPQMRSATLSREAAFLLNNLLFAAFALLVLLGTVFPLVVEALNDDRLAVGGPYFELLGRPLGLALLALMGLAVLLPWRTSSTELLSQRALVPAWCGAAALVGAVVAGATGWASLVAFALGGFAAGAALRQLVLDVRRHGPAGFLGGSGGGMVVHLGVVVLAFGLVASQSYTTEDEVRLVPGEEAVVGGHRVEYLDRAERTGAGDRAITTVRLRVDGDEVHEPAITRFPNFGTPIATPSVDTSFVDDVYLAVVSVPEAVDDPVVVRVIVQPLIVWLWIGGGLMALGTLLAIVPRRRSRTASSEAEEPATGEPADDVAGPAEPALVGVE